MKQFLYQIKGTFDRLSTKNEEELSLDIEKFRNNIKKIFFNYLVCYCSTNSF